MTECLEIPECLSEVGRSVWKPASSWRVYHAGHPRTTTARSASWRRGKEKKRGRNGEKINPLSTYDTTSHHYLLLAEVGGDLQPYVR